MRAAVFLLLLVGVAYAERPSFAPMQLTIEVAGEKSILFVGEFAETPEQLAHGLMFQSNLAENYAMLFDLGRPKKATFWMQNVVIPLDMIFITEGGIIDSILKNVPPLSTELRRSQGSSVRWVVEVAGGTADRFGIRAGDRIISDKIN